MSGGPKRVVSATGDAKQSKSTQQNKKTAHAVPIVASGKSKPADGPGWIVCKGGTRTLQMTNHKVMTNLRFVIPTGADPGFPTARHEQRPRVRLSLRKAACSSLTPPNPTGNPGVAQWRDLRFLFSTLPRARSGAPWGTGPIHLNHALNDKCPISSEMGHSVPGFEARVRLARAGSRRRNQERGQAQV
jgi:hypothetical protein